MMIEMAGTAAIAILGCFLALGLSSLLYKKRYPVRKWHGQVGVVVSIALVIAAVELFKNTVYNTPFVLIGILVAVCSFGVIRAAERIERDQKAAAGSREK